MHYAPPPFAEAWLDIFPLATNLFLKTEAIEDVSPTEQGFFNSL